MLNKILLQLEHNTDISVAKRYEKLNVPKPYFAVKKSVINKIAKENKKDNELAISLWETKNLDAMLVAIQLFNAKTLIKEDVENLIDEKLSFTILDPFIEKVVFNTKDWKYFEQKFINSKSLVLNRLAWRLRVKYVSSKKATDKEINDYLKIIEHDLTNVDEIVKWSMNYCFVMIAVYYEKYRDYCIKLGEELAVYKDEKVAKGCTSSYAPEWITAVLKNKRLN